MTRTRVQRMDALARLPVSTLCDVDKSLPVVDPAIRPLTFTTRIAGPAYTVVASGEFLSVLYAIGEAAPGDVLVVQAGGTVPMAGRSDVAPRVGGAVVCGGVRVEPGQLVLADDDGIVIAPREQLEACVERANAIERVEAKVLGEVRVGGSLIGMTNLAEHVAALRAGEASSLSITP